MSVSMWFYFQRVLIPYQAADAAAHNRPRGTLSDLYPRWLGSRELLMNRRDPYSDEITRDIQIGYYGRVLDPSRPDDPKDQQRFAYPVYVTFLLAPLTRLPFPTVRAMFVWILGLITAISVLLWLRVVRWRPSLAVTVIVLLLSVNSIPAIQGIKLQQLSLLVAGMIAICAVLVVEGHLVLAGIVLALATIKPQLALLPVLWLMLWAFSGWRERQRLVWSFAGTLAVLFAGSEYLLAGWIPEFVAALKAYQHYTGGVSQLGAIATPLGGMLLTFFAAVAAVFVCWNLRRVPANSEAFGVGFAFVLAITGLIVGLMVPYNQVILFPAVFLIARSWRVLWRRNRMTRLLCTLGATMVFWPWAVSVALLAISPFVAPQTLHRAWAIPLWSSIGGPILTLPLIFILAAKAVRNRTGVAAPAFARADNRA